MLKKLSLFVAAVMVLTIMFAAFPYAAESAAEVEEYVRFTANGNDPYATFMFSDNGNDYEIDPDTVTWAAIRYRTGSQYDSTGVEYTAQFYVCPAAEPCIPIKYNFSGNWETAIVDLTSVSDVTDMDSIWDSSYYTATSTIRFDPLEPDRDPEDTSQDDDRGQVNDGDYIDIAWIAFFEKEEDAKAYTGKENTPYCILDTDSLMILSSAHNLSAELFDSEGAVAPTEPPAGLPVKYSVSPRSLDPKQFTAHETAIEFTVPEGKSFKSFILGGAPTWNVQENSTLDAVIYAWNRDYDTTIEGKELGTFREEKHPDNTDLEMDFGVILPPGKYLICMTAEDDPIGAWGGTMDEINYDAVFYFDGDEDDSWFPYSDIMLIDGTESAIVLPTSGPTAEPTEKPTAAPTAAPTEKAETAAPATDEAKPTEAAPSGDNNSGTKGNDDKTGMPLGAIIGIVAAAVVAAAVVIAIVIKKKKK